MVNSREITLKILEEIIYNKAYSNIALNQNINKYKAFENEAFIRELVYGVMENKLYLDYIIKKTSRVKLKKIHEKIYLILLIGIYQIYFMEKVPLSAAVNEAVNLAKKFGNKGSIGYVNGLLRNITRNKDELGQIKIQDKIQNISVKYSHPTWLVEYFISEFGFEFTEKLLIANNEVPNFTIRVNSLKINKGRLKERLRNEGYIISDSEISESSLIIENPKDIFKTREFKEGLFIVQGEASSLVGEVINPSKEKLVLDTCAAPGGKAIHMASIMENTGKVIARDIYKHRLDLMNENAKRLGLDNLVVEEYDATKLDLGLKNKIDYCLVDAPCSGFGTIRRNPEIKYNRTYEDLISLAKLQESILETSKDYVKIGGTLVYSTCTIGSLENDNIVNRFLAKNDNYKLDGDFIKLYPSLDNTDGFFIAKMTRIR